MTREADGDELLPGEDPRSELADDAAHWLRVYLELASTTRVMIKNFGELIAAGSREAREELEETDLRVLTHQLDRYERGLRFSRERQAGISGREDRSA
jgi:hypothetical protein